ncbi:hypothetical protein [Paenibacillus phytorum]|uniref:hypothetical protein n=1 Tax=Paenibacillus phytorum TaxID=2654977 RepID=UPI001FEBCAAD
MWNNPINFIDPSGFDPVTVGHVYDIEGPYQGKTESYVGSTAQELLERMGKHKWKALVADPATTVTTYEVKAELNVAESARGTQRSALNEALRAAEQQVIDKKGGKDALLNDRNAATKENGEYWTVKHKVEIDMNSSKLSLKGGAPVGAFAGFALWDAFLAYRSMVTSKYEFAPYLLEDGGGVFTIGYGRNGWLDSTKYWKTYQTGPMAEQKVYVGEDDFDFWKKEAQALWGRLDFWGNFVPGLLNPVLPVVDPNEA